MPLSRLHTQDILLSKIVSVNEELAQAVANQWKNSPPHWKNILDPAFKYLGTGAARGPYDEKKQDSFYMTQNFCGSLNATAEAKAKPLLQPKSAP